MSASPSRHPPSGAPAAVGWLADRFAGAPLPAEPETRTVVSTLLSRHALRSRKDWLAAIGRLAFGRL